MNVIEQFGALSPQQCFDISAQHILKTRKKSVVGLSCSYRGSGCAATPFLDPAFVTKAENIGSWDRLLWGKHVPPQNGELIAELQQAHDSTFDENFLTEWKRNMRTVAKNHGLSARLIDEDDKSCKCSCTS